MICPNCGSSHENTPNWYCRGCQERFLRWGLPAFIDADGLKVTEAQRVGEAALLALEAARIVLEAGLVALEAKGTAAEYRA
jgi:hypothetical protein